MIEPQDAYTVQRRPLMPPKPERIMPTPRLSMEDDAKLCNQRMWAAQGRTHRGVCPGQDINHASHLQAIAEREALAEKALVIIAKRPRTSADLRELLGETDNRTRAALGLLKSQGRVIFKRNGPYVFWEAVE